MTTAVTIGEGVLTWRRGERIGDRYGAVSLMAEGGNSLSAERVAWLPLTTATTAPRKVLGGQRGRLEAHVLATRQSTHIGDFFRGFSPSTPEVGEVIVLGGGTLFFEEHRDDGPRYAAVGLRPDDDRTTDWLDPPALYRAHEQTVRLLFVPEA